MTTKPTQSKYATSFHLRLWEIIQVDLHNKASGVDTRRNAVWEHLAQKSPIKRMFAWMQCLFFWPTCQCSLFIISLFYIYLNPKSLYPTVPSNSFWLCNAEHTHTHFAFSPELADISPGTLTSALTPLMPMSSPEETGGTVQRRRGTGRPKGSKTSQRRPLMDKAVSTLHTAVITPVQLPAPSAVV